MKKFIAGLVAFALFIGAVYGAYKVIGIDEIINPSSSDIPSSSISEVPSSYERYPATGFSISSLQFEDISEENAQIIYVIAEGEDVDARAYSWSVVDNLNYLSIERDTTNNTQLTFEIYAIIPFQNTVRLTVYSPYARTVYQISITYNYITVSNVTLDITQITL